MEKAFCRTVCLVNNGGGENGKYGEENVAMPLFPSQKSSGRELLLLPTSDLASHFSEKTIHLN